MKTVIIRKSPKPQKKWRATFVEPGRHKSVDFGLKGYSDYTKHKNRHRMFSYVRRHSGMHENWGWPGRYSAGFWSRWLLWSRPTLQGALRVVRQKLPGYRVILRPS
jgi:hypothetical protein